MNILDEKLAKILKSICYFQDFFRFIILDLTIFINNEEVYMKKYLTEKMRYTNLYSSIKRYYYKSRVK